MNDPVPAAALSPVAAGTSRTSRTSRTEARSTVSDHVSPPPPEPEEIDDTLRAEIAAVQELAAAGIEIDGEAQVCESTWVLYGHSSYDGEIVVGEYQDVTEATAVLRAITRPGPEPDRGPDRDEPVP